MTEDPANFATDDLDRAISRRLSRLSTMPVDTSRLARAIRSQVCPSPVRRIRIHTLRAVAASVLIVGTITAVLMLSVWERPALASTDELLKVHESVVCSVDGSDQTPICCLREISRRPVKCTAMKIDGAAVSMTVADASRLRMPSSDTIQRHGKVFRVHSAGATNMVMIQRDGRWGCLMGPLPNERLMDTLDRLDW